MSPLSRFARTFTPSRHIHARLAHGIYWSVVNVGVTQFMAMVTSIVAARLLGDSAFGEWSMTRSTVLMLGVLAGTGLGIAATRHIAEFRHTNPQRASRILTLLLFTGLVIGFFASLLCFIFARPLAVSLMHSEGLVSPLKIASLLLMLNTLNGILVGVLIGLERYRAIALSALMEGFVNLFLVTGGAWLFGVPGAVGGMLVSAATGFTVRSIVVKRKCVEVGLSFSRHGWLRELPILKRVAVPSLLMAASVQPFEWLGRLMLSRQTDGFAEVGIFAAVQSYAQIVLVFPAQVTGSSMPILASLYAQRDFSSFRRLIFMNILLAVGLGIIVSAPLFVFSERLMALYGSSFMAGSHALRVMLITYSMVVVTMVFTEVLVASDRAWTQTFHKFSWGVSMTGAAYILANQGALGLAYAYAIGNAVFLVLQLVTTASLIKATKST